MSETTRDMLKRMDAERMWHVRRINNGFLVEVRGGVSWSTLESYACKDVEGVIEILASVMGAAVDVERRDA